MTQPISSYRLETRLINQKPYFPDISRFVHNDVLDHRLANLPNSFSADPICDDIHNLYQVFSAGLYYENSNNQHSSGDLKKLVKDYAADKKWKDPRYALKKSWQVKSFANDRAFL